MGRAREAARTGREVAALLLAVGAAALVLSALGVGCPIRFLTGVSCPGCGMTRAWLELARLHVGAALAYHPLFWLFPVAVALAAVPARTARARRVVSVLAVAAAVALLVLWVVRLLDPCDLMLLGDLAGPGDVVGVGEPGWLALLAP